MREVRLQPLRDYYGLTLSLFVLFCANYLSIRLSGGEEQYLAYAKQHINPDWIPNSFSISEFPGSRLIFQWLTGSLLQVMPFPTAVLLLRSINFLLLAMPIARIAKTLKISHIHTLAMTQTFLFLGQHFFGGEWIIRSVEPKTFAYVFVLFAFHNVLIDNFRKASVLMALATWFHFLVGGWIMLIFLIYRYLSKKKEALQLLLLYSVLVLPLFIYMFKPLLVEGGFSKEGVNLNWVYCYYRLKNHIGLFDSFYYFYQLHFSRVLVTSVWFFVCVVLLRGIPDGNRANLRTLSIIMLGQALFFVLVALFDKVFLNKSGGLFLKFYPFRTMSMALYIALLLLFSYLSNLKTRKSLYTQWGIAILSGLFFIQSLARNAEAWTYKEPDYEELISYIRTYTPDDAVFVFPDRIERYTVPFIRRTERESFVLFKFVPAGTEKLHEWYIRMEHLEALYWNQRHILNMSRQYDIDYLIATKPFTVDSLRMVFQNSTFFMYEIPKQ